MTPEATSAAGTFGSCDWGDCDGPGVASYEDAVVGAIPVCAEHAARCPEDELDRPPPAPRPDVEPAPAAPAAAPAATPTPLDLARPQRQSGADALLSRARRHRLAKVRRAGGRVELLLDALRDQVREADDVELRRLEQQEAKRAARAEVDRLERELREARAKLRTAPAAPAPADQPDSGAGAVDLVAFDRPLVDGPLPCAGCSAVLRRPKGTPGPWPTRCEACRTRRASA